MGGDMKPSRDTWTRLYEMIKLDMYLEAHFDKSYALVLTLAYSNRQNKFVSYKPHMKRRHKSKLSLTLVRS